MTSPQAADRARRLLGPACRAVISPRRTFIFYFLFKMLFYSVFIWLSCAARGHLVP